MGLSSIHLSSNISNSHSNRQQIEMGRPEARRRREQVPLEYSELLVAAQRGDVAELARLIESEQFSVHDTSPDGTTALHWAAINNAIEAVNYLLDHGAEVDKKGGELMATPLLWACRVGLSDMAYLLIQRGADPLRTDAQGFNALHIAIHSSNIMLIVYLLHQGLPVDYADPQQRTALHWAAYQGDPLSVDVLLRWGADVRLKDDTGFTPLHWAVVRGNMASMKRLIEEGSDVKAETADGKTPAIIAKEMMCYPVWLLALKKAGRDPDGMTIPKKISQYMLRRVVFFWPWMMLFITFEILTWINAFVAIALSLVWLWGSHTLLMKIIESGSTGSVQIHKTPYLSGIFSGSAFLVAVRWFFFILPGTANDRPFANLLFFIVFGLSMFFFVKSMSMDPGFIPKPAGNSEQREIIDELLSIGEYDSRHFCIYCFTRRPLRSKHCRVCEKCVARVDHHCPWINNCVGVRNHRAFLLYVILLETAIPILLYLTYEYFSEVDDDDDYECMILKEDLCAVVSYDPFTLFIALWSAVQLTWVSILTVVQLYQVCRALTTNEAYNLHRYGWMGGAGDDEAVPSGLADPYAADKPGAFTHNHHHHGGALAVCCKLLGITQFISLVSDFCASSKALSFLSASASGGHHRESSSRPRNTISNHYNPFDGGFVNNCRDFWGGDESVFSQKLTDADGTRGNGKIKGRAADYYRLWDVAVGASSVPRRFHNAEEDYDALPGYDVLV
ncbi:Palmitoyltransferase AKR1 [Myxozyma melibiosi]|uniref:Palmitoyltransferase n=1 Tax=Myxozyma melibiosi TaxID=54550 RepID=A0ABR1FF95_9ASCO